jgi:hypothetical protein
MDISSFLRIAQEIFQSCPSFVARESKWLPGWDPIKSGAPHPFSLVGTKVFLDWQAAGAWIDWPCLLSALWKASSREHQTPHLFDIYPSNLVKNKINPIYPQSPQDSRRNNIKMHESFIIEPSISNRFKILNIDFKNLSNLIPDSSIPNAFKYKMFHRFKFLTRLTLHGFNYTPGSEIILC